MYHTSFGISFQIDREREGEQIDQALVKNILAIYVEIGMNSLKYYTGDFEEAMLKDSAAFYSQKASNWITTKSYEDYMLKVILNTNSTQVSALSLLTSICILKCLINFSFSPLWKLRSKAA